jgi:alpha-glucosidase
MELNDVNIKKYNSSVGGKAEWWRSAVIYQVYPRSFADANGDGVGDLQGVIREFDHIAGLGADAIWLSPFFLSPQADAGYDVSDYRDVDPLFGTLSDFDELLEKAHKANIKIIVDLVPNHTSAAHPWFKSALAEPPEGAARQRYMFRDGRGNDGELPPNNWQSLFGGQAWTKVEGEKQWYLHLFDSSQPDLNWRNPEVREEFESILRFWLDRGVDGFRIDVARGLIKQEGLPDWDGELTTIKDGRLGPMFDQDEVHDIYRSWRHVLDEYAGDRVLVAEAWVPPHRLPLYIRPDEMQQAFNFDYMLAHWDAAELRSIVDKSLVLAAEVGAAPSWVMSNHDDVRHTSRLGLIPPGARPKGIGPLDPQPDEALGLRRARAWALLTFALPGSAYIYQGEELGLPDHTTMENHHRQDPSFFRNNGNPLGRDGCRVPLPWKSSGPAFGFSAQDRTWLPQPESFSRYSADIQVRDEQSTLSLYRKLLELRREHGLGNGSIEWLQGYGPEVLAFRNGALTIVINLGTSSIPLPSGKKILLSSVVEEEHGVLAGNAAMWLTDN